jgi:hypothetical protein
MPLQRPKYRNNRSHLDFVTNIFLPVEKFKQNLQEIFQVSARLSVSDEETEALKRMMKEKKDELKALEDKMRQP